jgi:hypothetical protein
MTVPVDAAALVPPEELPRLVLVAMGSEAELVTLQASAAPRLALLTGLALREISSPRDPDRSLAALLDAPVQAAQPLGWLAPLSLDPGLALSAGGSWAAALGAWRQPTLLLVDGHRPASGLAAAATALLRQEGVPLLGLIQWHGAWNSQERQLDGLPWLGWLGDAPAADPAAQEAAAALLPALRLRWQQRD